MRIEVSRQVPESLATWFTHEEPLIVTAIDGPSIRGFLPLKRSVEQVLGFDAVHLEPAAPYHVHADAEAAAAMLQHLVATERFDLLALTGEHFVAASKRLNGFAIGAQSTLGPARAAVGLGSDLDVWFHSLEGGAAPMARRTRSLMSTGELELVSSDDPWAGRELLNLYVELEARTPKLDAATGVTGDPRRAARYAALADAGEALFHFLLLDGLPIAGSISLRAGDKLVQLEGACDMSFEDAAPDEVLFMLEVREAIARQASALELCADLTDRATRLGARVSETHRVQLFRRFRADHIDALWRQLTGAGVEPAPSDGPMRSDLSRQMRARTHAAEALDRLESRGARVTRLWGDQLRAAMPFDVGPAEHERVRRAV